jgi:SAM-dependent methyltransferase
MSDADYRKQKRGGDRAYERYLAGMDASMRQKVALTAAHLLAEGTIADMGMGSGSGSFALASLYPELEVTGVDVNPEMVERASERHVLPNLRFVVGDIAEPCLPSGSMDAILDSSVLHHVTSFNGYEHQAAMEALAVQSVMLKPGGILVVRDFLDPGPGEVWLDLPADDPELKACFERFCRDFRMLLPEESRGCEATEEEGPEGWHRFRMRHTMAAEFVLRKDYRRDWDLEILEEYTYATQASFETGLASLGLRVLASTPIWNPWIVTHRFEGKFRLWSLEGEALDFPATNYVVVGQKVEPGEGVRLVPGPETLPMGYLEMSHWAHRKTGEVYDLARRPGTTIDVLPWFHSGDSVHVLARRSYPRPIPACHPAPLDGSMPPTWVTEPLNVQQGDKPLGQTVDELLSRFEGIGPEGVRNMRPGTCIYPSPGGLQEQVRSVLVEVNPVRVEEPTRSLSGWTTSGLLRSMEARQLLRAAQVGALPDARLELHVYELLLRLGLDPGPWIGEGIELAGEAPVESAAIADLLDAPPRRCFRQVSRQESGGFLQVRARHFEEMDSSGEVLNRRKLEYVMPSRLSANTLAVALLRRSNGQVLLGLDDHDLPAAQCFMGNSNLWVTPAWRLPLYVSGRARSEDWLRGRIEAEYTLQCGDLWELGGRFYPSAGATPEVVHPFAVEILGGSGARQGLHWVPLVDVLRCRGGLPDGHLRVVSLRAAHALGFLSPIMEEA